VALRGSGELLTITGADRQLRPICGEPRGLAWEETSDLIHVACATGELVSVPAGGGDPVRTLRLERDLRDVIVRDDGLAVSTFRSAQLIELDAQGTEIGRVQPPITDRFDFDDNGNTITIDAIPEVAWRTIALPDGRLVMAHQRRLGTVLKVQTGGYGGQCNSSPVESTLTIVGTDDAVLPTAPIAFATLPVDVAANPVTGDLAVVTAGQSQIVIVAASQTTSPDPGGCGGMSGAQFIGFADGAPTSVAYRPDGTLLAFYPENDNIIVYGTAQTHAIALGGTPATDPGRRLFHEATPIGLACASCHPEGRDDGGVWTFDTLGQRRTQSLAGGILSRAPYHWGGDMPTLHALVENVLTERMSGPAVSIDDERALGAWLDRLPAAKGVTVDAAQVLRGKDLFEAPEQGCVSCHTGALLTNNKLAIVGTGGPIKVPSLVGVGARAPFLHTGCAPTLRDRFGTCGGGDAHGHTSQLSEAELADLTAYLESL
jgi:cytochrome c553